jgi:tetratricopeptide (TPR) repeat protein
MKRKLSPQTSIQSQRRRGADVSEARALVAAGQWADAIRLLEEMEACDPGREEVLFLLFQAYREIGDSSGLQWTCERVLRVHPNHPEITLGLAATYFATEHPALGLRTLQEFLRHWPDHPEAPAAQAQVETCQAHLRLLLGEMGVPEEDVEELAPMHEQVQVLIGRARFAEAIRTAEQLLRRWPKFVPALNNLSLAQATEGSLPRAIATARRALAVDPQNVHALANLVHFLCASGEIDAAQEPALRLKSIPSRAPERWVKQAEAFSYLGDDEGVLEAYEGARRARKRGDPPEAPFLLHLAAVAAMRLGDESRARRLWRQALKLAPDMTLAHENLEDLRKPPEERHAPWAFDFANWVSPKVFAALGVEIQRAAGRGSEEAVRRALSRFLKEHPEVARLLPLLLDRGDPTGRGWALNVAMMAGVPEMSAALKEFALSRRGPVEMRLRAGAAARKAGLLPAGFVRFWTGSEWQNVLLANFQVHGEPRPLPANVVELADEARDALKSDRPADAERALKEALTRAPDRPELMNNLSISFQLQGRQAEYEELVRRLHELHPDYLFGRTAMAHLAVQAGDLAGARAFLDPLLERTEFHFSEFAALCQAQMELYLAEGKPDLARDWLGMWESIDRENPQIDRWRRYLRRHGRPPRGR